MGKDIGLSLVPLKTIILIDQQPLFHDFAVSVVLALCMMAFYDPNDLSVRTFLLSPQ